MIRICPPYEGPIRKGLDRDISTDGGAERTWTGNLLLGK
jgi:hypothetical protein